MPDVTYDPAPAPAFSPSIAAILQRTQPWTRFMGIAGFVAVGFMLLVGLSSAMTGVAAGAPEAMLMMVYPVMALLYVVPSLYLLKFSSRVREFVTQGQPQQLEAALDAQRSFWKFVGILTLVSLALVVLMFVAAALFWAWALAAATS